MRACSVQFQLEEKKEDNLRKALKYIEKASGYDLVLLPEMLMGMRRSGVELYHLAEDAEDGAFASALREAAVKHSVDVCACLWEESGTDKVYNTAVVFGADGSIKAKYRKLHLFDALSVKESDIMIKGDTKPPVFECGGVMCGLSICYDLRFPEIYRSLVNDGAEIFLLPAAWYAGEMKAFHLQTLLAARAIENTSYILSADLCGGNFTGFSSSFDPFGKCLSLLEAGEGIVDCPVDKAYLESVRKQLPCLTNFRRDILS